MAVSGNTEEVKTVLTIETSKSASSMKELRQQIKDLKDELVGLDEGSQEYADTLVVLGEKMHQVKEINEQVARTNTDFGDTLGNLSNVMSGGVAAVQGLTAGLSLLGFQMGDDDKLTQTLVKSMALLQSLGTMDKAIKSFKALSLVMKSNIAAAGGLGKALKALALSNPFTAILAGATAVVGVFAVIRNKAKENAKELEEFYKAAAQNAQSFIDNMDNISNLYSLNTKYAAEVKQQEAELAKFREEYSKNFVGDEQELTVALMQELKKRRDQQLYYGNERMAIQYNMQIELLTSQGNYISKSLTQWDNYMNRLKKQDEDLKAEQKKWQQDRNKAAADAAKQRVEAQIKAEDSAYKHEQSLLKQNREKQLQEIENKYQEEIIRADGAADEIAKAEEKKMRQIFQIDSNYYIALIALTEQYKEKVEARDNKDGSQTANIDALNETIISLNKSLDESANAWRNFTHEQYQANLQSGITKDTLNAQSNLLEQEIELTKAHNERYLALIKDKYTLQADLQAEAIRYEREQLETEGIGIENELARLQAEHDAKLISEEEYQNQVLELEKQRIENQARLRELDVEDEKNKLERKKELNEIYSQAISSISNSLVTVLNAAAQQEDASFETQKKLQIASTIISTLTAAMEAYKSVAGIPLIGAYLAPAAAAATIATGMLNVRKIQQTNKNSNSAAVSTGAVQTIQAPTQMTNITGFSDNITLPEQRVVVLATDIMETTNRIVRVETNSSI